MTATRWSMYDLGKRGRFEQETTTTKTSSKFPYLSGGNLLKPGEFLPKKARPENGPGASLRYSERTQK
jgi:hypothetical protein